MTLYEKVVAFLGHYGFITEDPDIDSIISGLLYDMQSALNHESGTHSLSGIEPMLPAWISPPSGKPEAGSVIVIDAGGTNLRSCLVSFDRNGIPSVSDLQKTAMPGIGHEYSKKEFFDAFASNLEHLKNKADTIGFCFSYAMEMTPAGDGKVIEFSKEIQAKEVVGSLMGESLSESLIFHGWKRPERIILLNDTTAALFAGAAALHPGRDYDSYIGFILGTGVNSAYIEPAPIEKISIPDRHVSECQIVVTEVGSYNRLARSDFDIELDAASKYKGQFILEKMCSGAYLGPVSSIAVRHACADGLFSEKFAEAFAARGFFDLADMDHFLYTPFDRESKLGAAAASATENDFDVLYLILDAFIERSARLAAAVIAAAVIKSGKGTRPSKPVCILCNGTTFHKTYGLKSRIMNFLDQVLTQERHLFYEIVTVDNDITLGTAVAALSAAGRK
jgi:hexokinase